MFDIRFSLTAVPNRAFRLIVHNLIHLKCFINISAASVSSNYSVTLSQHLQQCLLSCSKGYRGETQGEDQQLAERCRQLLQRGSYQAATGCAADELDHILW